MIALISDTYIHIRVYFMVAFLNVCIYICVCACFFHDTYIYFVYSYACNIYIYIYDCMILHLYAYSMRIWFIRPSLWITCWAVAGGGSVPPG